MVHGFKGGATRTQFRARLVSRVILEIREALVFIVPPRKRGNAEMTGGRLELRDVIATSTALYPKQLSSVGIGEGLARRRLAAS